MGVYMMKCPNIWLLSSCGASHVVFGLYSFWYSPVGAGITRQDPLCS